MPYMEDERPYLFVKTVLILPDRGLRINFLPSLIVRTVAIHLGQVAPHFTPVLAFPRTSSKLWADGLLKLGRFTFTTTLLYAPNYSLQLFAFASIINMRFPLTATHFHLLTPPPSPTPNINSLS